MARGGISTIELPVNAKPHPGCFSTQARSLISASNGPKGSPASLSGSLPDAARIRGVRPDLPIYLFSGTADPIAGEGALIELVGDRYREAGVRDVTVKLYPEARHETLNETNRDEVTADLIGWLDRVVTR